MDAGLEWNDSGKNIKKLSGSVEETDDWFVSDVLEQVEIINTTELWSAPCLLYVGLFFHAKPWDTIWCLVAKKLAFFHCILN